MTGAAHLYSIHDAVVDWAMQIRDAGMTGWAIISEGIGANPNDYSGVDYAWLAQYGVTPIVRLSYSHHGEGTIPLPVDYRNFAQRCANFVTYSHGCQHWIIGNEPNISGERCQGIPIYPHQYAECFRLCRNAIKGRSVEHQVIPAAIAPYNDETDWCIDYFQAMLSRIIQGQGDGGCDGLALHTYSRGADPASITSTAKMGFPYDEYSSGFLAYRDFLAAVPAILRALPVYITETDQLDPWLDANNGWVQQAYAEINNWNWQGGQGIYCLALYRWQNYDQWGFQDKRGVQEGFIDALDYGYPVPDSAGQPMPPDPMPPEPVPPQPTPPPPPTRDLDPRLLARGVTFTFVEPQPGTWYWRITKAEWFNEEQSQGRHHIFVRVLDSGGNLAVGVPLTFFWSSGSDTKPTEHKSDPWLASVGLGADYSRDFGMNAVAPAYGVKMGDGKPTDSADGCGLGSLSQPDYKIHTSYFFEIRLVTASESPTPEPPAADLTHPLPGAFVTQNFYENRDYYGQWNLIGHDGTDLGGVPVGANILSIAAGEVAFAGFDQDYGNYVRITHRQLLPPVYSFYAHCESILVAEGTRVVAGQVIARVGYTGNVSPPGPAGAHLHLEIRGMDEGGNYITTTPMPKGRCDPASYLGLRGVKL
jgi:murein DD-endopeptidase MepM/ murein hydrolase activator NlpD